MCVLFASKTKSGLNIHSEIQVKNKSMSNWGAGTTGDHVAPPLYEYERSASFHFHSQSFLAFLQPTLPFPAGQTIECRSLVFLRRPPFYKPEAPLVFFIQSLTTDTHSNLESNLKGSPPDYSCLDAAGLRPVQ